jgi:CheY-like chemotaxis protein
MPRPAPTAAYVLVVDGYDATREALVLALERGGIHARGAGEEEDAIRAVGEHPGVSAILLDLPLSESVEAACALRALPVVTAATIVIALIDPSRATGRERDAARAQGIDYFFLRPCPPAEIIKQLQRLSVRRRT